MTCDCAPSFVRLLDNRFEASLAQSWNDHAWLTSSWAKIFDLPRPNSQRFFVTQNFLHGPVDRIVFAWNDVRLALNCVCGE